MKPTKTLPSPYIHYIDLCPGKYRKGHLLVLLIAIPITLGIYSFLNKVAFLVRLDHLQSPTWNPKMNLEILIGLLLVTLAVIAAHEGVHGLLLWLFTRERPNLGIQFPGVGVEAPEWYIPRNQLMIVGIAPLILLTLIGAVLLFTVPSNMIGTVAIGMTINMAGSYMDIAVVMYAYLLPISAYIRPDRGYASIFFKRVEGLQDTVPEWKCRLRRRIEQEILPKLV
jgi:hypothetical protein